jgi:hypothetical protein
MRRDDERHGTHAGYIAHQREGKRPCRACKDANNAYMRAHRERTTAWRDQQHARNRALTKLARLYRDEFRRLYEAELGDA